MILICDIGALYGRRTGVSRKDTSIIGTCLGLRELEWGKILLSMKKKIWNLAAMAILENWVIPRV